MAYSYTRQSTIADGNTITAAIFNNEYNALLNAFAYSSSDAGATGHRHDGTAAQGGSIYRIGDLDFLNKIEADSTNNRWGFYVEVSSSAVEQIRIQDGAVLPVTDSDVDLGTSSLYFKDAYIDSITTTGNVAVGGNITVTGNATISGNLTFGDAATDTVAFSADVASNLLPSADNTYDIGASGSEWKDLYIDGTANIDSLAADTAAIADLTSGRVVLAGTSGELEDSGNLTFNGSTLTVTGAVTASSTMQGTTITATTAFVPDASDGAALGTSSLEFSDLFLADGAVINLGADQDTTLTHVADTGILLNSTRQLQFGDSGTYIHQSADGVLDLVSDTEIEINATTVDMNGALDLSGNATVGGTLAVTGAVTGSSTIQGTTITATTAFVPDASDGATLGSASLEFSDLYLADGAVVYFGADQDVSLTHVADTGVLLSSTDQLQFGDSGTYIHQSADGVLDLVSDTEIELNATTIDINGAVDISGNLDVGGNLVVTGTTTFNGGTLTMGDAATDNVVFGADVNSNIIPNTDNTYDLGSSSQEWKDIYIDGTAYLDAINFNGTAISATAAEINYLDITTLGTVEASKAVTADANADVLFGDSDKLKFGASSDLAIYHDANHSYIEEAGTGALKLKGDDIRLEDSSGNNIIKAVSSSAELYEAGSKKLETTSSGIDVTGTVTADGLTVDGNATITVTDNSNTLTLKSTDADENSGPRLALTRDSGSPADNDYAGLISFNADDDGGNSTRFSYMVTQIMDASNGSEDGALRFFATVAGAEVETLTLSSDIALDSVGTITLDADTQGSGNGILLKDAGTHYGSIFRSESNLHIKSEASDKDILFMGSDGGSEITALTLDMSEAGAATFNSSVAIDASSLNAAGDIDDPSDYALVIRNPSTDDQGNGIAFTNDAGQHVGGAIIHIDKGSNNLGDLAFYTAATSSNPEERFRIKSNGTITTATSGTNNLRLGDGAGAAIASGGNLNTVIGDSAGAAITTGDNNVAVGYAAGDALTTGEKNIAIGVNALGSDTTGGRTVAIGQGALTTQNQTGGTSTYNVAVGYEAGAYVTTGTGLTFIGGLAGDATTTGADNTGVGYQALTSNTTAANNTAVGVSALKLNTTGANNTAVGRGALLNQTTASYNVAVGYNALNDVTTGQYNTGLGSYAGQTLTIGNSNSAVGYAALNLTTTGSYNVAFGESALSANTTASSNTAIGYQALNANTTGTQNVAVGARALDANTTANSGTAVGNNALSANTTGPENVAVGESALELNTTGGTNVAVGREALAANTTASNNTGLGYRALTANTTGVQNVAMGAYAGDALTTGGENVAIGAYALSAEDANGKNVAVGTQALLSQNAGADAYNTAVGYLAGKAVTTGVQNVLIGGLAGDALITGSNVVAVGYGALTYDTKGFGSVAIGNQALENQNFTSNTDTYNTAVGYFAGNDVTTGIHNTLIGGLSGDALTTGVENVAVGYSALSAATTSSQNVAIGRCALNTNVLGSKNTAVGYNSLNAMNPASATDTNNTAVGHNAGASITTGIDNVAVGADALIATTTGNYNTAVGYRAADSVTTGNYNVALGRRALDAVTTTSYNIAIGSSALESNTGQSNTAVGHNALNANTSANDNTAFGYVSQISTTTGAQNVSVGAYSLDSNTTGQRNVAMGWAAMDASTTGSYNTAVGYAALDACTTASNNTAIGYQALSASTTGYDNTAIGEQAGASVTTGWENVFVGTHAGDSTDDGKYNTAVGHEALSANCGDVNAAFGYVALNQTTGSDNTGIGPVAGYELTSGSNCTFLGHDAGRTGSPGGAITTASNILSLGDENVATANIQVDWTVASDERDKTDFADLDLGLDFVKALEPVTYYWDKRSKYGDKHAEDYDLNAQTPDGTHKEDWMDIGFKAQSVQALEEAAGYTAAAKKNLTVSSSEDGKQLGLQYSKFVPILVKAIQELSAQNAALTARIEALES